MSPALSLSGMTLVQISRHSKGNGIDGVSSRHVEIMISEILSRLSATSFYRGSSLSSVFSLIGVADRFRLIDNALRISLAVIVSGSNLFGRIMDLISASMVL